MDYSELLIEGAGVALVGTLVTGVIAVLYERRRLVFGIVIGLTLALAVLPFVAYVVALVTHHLATNVDLTPPAYIVATAIACAALALLGLAGGAIAETRHHATHPTPKARDAAYHDNPTEWLPWRDSR